MLPVEEPRDAAQQQSFGAEAENAADKSRRLSRQEDVSLDLIPRLLLRGMLSHQEIIAPKDDNQVGALSGMAILVLASAVAWAASLLLLVVLW
jgi:hypothetical protein